MLQITLRSPVQTKDYGYPSGGHILTVLANNSIPDSYLKNKSQSITYPMIREVTAMDEYITSYINTNYNDSYLLTKQLN